MGQDSKSRREREEEARKAHILDVTEQLFAAKGLHDTSVADIAREAEFGVGTIYKYFRDRDNLIQSLIGDRLKGHFEEIEHSLTRGKTPLERINWLIDAYVQSMHRRQKFFRIYFTHFHPGSHEDCCRMGDNDFVMDRRKRVIERIHDVFSQGIEEGQFVPVDPQYLAAALFGMAISFAFLAERKFEGEREWDVQSMKDALKTILFQGVVKENDK